MTNIDIRTFFKKIVNESAQCRDPYVNREDWTVLGNHSSAPSGWFTGRGNKHFKKPGKYAHLTDEYIDTVDLAKLQDEMLLFIADSFKQR